MFTWNQHQKNDSFNKQSHKFSSVITDNNYNSNNSAFFYEIEQLLDKRITNVRNKIKIEYLVRWYNYKSEWNVWYNIKNLQQASDFIINYERIFNNASEKSLSAMKSFKCHDKSLKYCDRSVKSHDKLQEF